MSSLPRHTAPEPPEAPVTVTMNEQGRIVIPAKLRKQLGWSSGEQLSVLVNEETREISLTTPRAFLDQLRRAAASQPNGRSVVDELIEERRFEAQLEALDDPEDRRRLRRDRNAP